MICLQLFLSFLKVGCFTFGGGYASIPLIRDIVLTKGWMTEDTFTYMIAVSESTPGPIMVNLASYVGTVQAGIPGALAATMAVVLPSFLIILLVAAVLKNAMKNRYVQAFLRGMKPCTMGIILATGLCMIVRNMSGENGIPDGRALLTTLVLAAVYFGSRKIGKPDNKKRGLSPIQLIILSAGVGMLVFAM
ncbi:MAG: chromate transporter [Lachnospiraceae bacterium]|nr:chromate transporter [Lachnospiraceae bacterium]